MQRKVTGSHMCRHMCMPTMLPDMRVRYTLMFVRHPRLAIDDVLATDQNKDPSSGRSEYAKKLKGHLAERHQQIRGSLPSGSRVQKVLWSEGL